MAITISRFLSATAIQGAADAFVETAITTDIVPANGFAFRLSRMVFDLSGGTSAVNNSILEFALSRDTKAAVPKYDDPDTLFYWARQTSFSTSGYVVNQNGFVLDFVEGIYVVDPTIYLQLDSNLTAVAQTMHARIYYEEVKLSEVEILRLLNNV